MSKPAIGLIEFNSIARGIITADTVLKKAPVELLRANPVCAGKYIILFAGDEASVDESLRDGIRVAGERMVDQLYLPNVHEQVIPAIIGASEVDKLDSFGVIETFSVASTIVAADVAAKVARIKLIEIRLANGMGGKSYFTMTGDLYEIEAALDAAKESASSQGMLVGIEIIPRPHEDLADKVL